MKDYRRNFLQNLSLEERLAGLPSDAVLQRFSPDQRLQGLSFDEVLRHWSPDEIEAYLASKPI